jgi:hypothetical protein
MLEPLKRMMAKYVGDATDVNSNKVAKVRFILFFYFIYYYF